MPTPRGASIDTQSCQAVFVAWGIQAYFSSRGAIIDSQSVEVVFAAWGTQAYFASCGEQVLTRPHIAGQSLAAQS